MNMLKHPSVRESRVSLAEKLEQVKLSDVRLTDFIGSSVCFLRVSRNRNDPTQASKRKAGTYSGGMKRRLSFIISTLGNPRIILLDEPVICPFYF